MVDNTYAITAASSAASSQLAAAKKEWNAFLNTYSKGDPKYDGFPDNWRLIAEPKLAEILQKYPAVSVYQNMGSLVSDKLGIATGIIGIGGPANVVNADDAYLSSLGARTTAENNLAAAQARVDAAKKENDRLLSQIGTTADTSPDLAGSATTPVSNTFASNNIPTSTTTTSRDRQDVSSANTVPVTQNGDAASTGLGADPAAGQAGSRGDRLPGDATGSSSADNTDTSDDSGTSTGAGSPNGTSTGTDVGSTGAGTGGNAIGSGIDLGIPLHKPTELARINNDYRTFLNLRDTNFSSDISYRVNDLTFKSITGYADFKAARSSDTDFSASTIGID